MLLPLPLRRRGVDGKDQRDLERVVPKALFLIEPCESSAVELHSTKPPFALRNICPCPSLLASSPRPARCGACCRLRERARPLRPISQALQRARAGLPAVLRPPRERLAPRIESGTIGLPRVASVPTAPPRPPKRARAMLVPFYASDARSPPPALSQIQNNVGETGVPRCPWCRASSCVRCE